jgi:nicotinamide-nucleotide amidase
MPNAEIIAIGSELLTSQRVDTNSLWLTEELNAIGIQVRQKTVVGDDEQCLEETLRDALKRSSIIISTGGLGPTEDDITRKIFSRVLRRPLVLDSTILDHIRRLFESRGLKMSANNERQALILRDATPLANPHGTAPGILVREGERVIALLPGPPREMKPMFATHVRPVLEPMSGGLRLRRRLLRISGMGESQVDSLIAPVYGRYANPTTTILFNNTEIELHLTASAATDAEAEALLDELAEQIEEKLGENVFAHRGETMEEVVGLRLTVKGYTIATAESCTGGLVAKRLTDVPGSSKYFREGVVAYANEAKTKLLDVPAELIAQHGAVSPEVAERMAVGVKIRSGATLGVSVTGIAGPDGGTPEKPVGLVYVGVAGDVGVKHRKFIFPGDRERIRFLTSQAALDLVRRNYLL